MTDSARHPDRPTADQLAEKVRDYAPTDRRWQDVAADADAALDALIALAKQREAYEEALAHARSLYRDGQQPLPGRLAAFKDWAQSGGSDGSEWIIVRREAAMLFASYFGHVPVESFAAAMTALEAAEARVAELERAHEVYGREWRRREQEHVTRTVETAERDEARHRYQRTYCAELLADRDRLAAALTQIMAYRLCVDSQPYYTEAVRIAREALNPGDGSVLIDPSKRWPEDLP